jgi:hypothetical protein
VVRQPNGVLAGIIWSDGSYHANDIVNRKTGFPAKKTTLKSLGSGKYQVKSAVAVWDDESPLDAVLA